MNNFGHAIATCADHAGAEIVVKKLVVLGAGRYGFAIPKDRVNAFQTANVADRFPVSEHGTTAVVTRARDLLTARALHKVDLHANAPLVPQTAKDAAK